MTDMDRALCKERPEKCLSQRATSILPQQLHLTIPNLKDEYVYDSKFESYFKNLAIDLVKQAQSKGWGRVGSYSFNQILEKIQTTKVVINKDGKTLKIEGRDTALYLCSENIVRINPINWESVERAERTYRHSPVVRGLHKALALHELIGASMGCGVDINYQVSMSIDWMSMTDYYPDSPFENKNQMEEQEVILVAGGKKGGTTAVGGGGDSVGYMAKKTLYWLFVAYLKEIEKERAPLKLKPIFLETFLNMAVEVYQDPVGVKIFLNAEAEAKAKVQHGNRDLEYIFNERTKKTGLCLGFNKLSPILSDPDSMAKVMAAVLENLRPYKKSGCVKRDPFEEMFYCF